ncbi:response regulator [Phenylobacterium sp.]|jgi:two-component system chemotaxis response regulator CheY|uniref:response regulator n=1 Tax=Phenylobacterium sp. TaxID=1871053 RepID=UPI0025F85CD5|nr:response regulator [Phenylobacterium sp.]MCA6285495.1 response regulator [Phenylobacterium sp.]MCA6309488.1 response regulator [Phenylobacterium sp.]MCA6323111.1 response regulator [Phenylobacterium sp.]MCA6337465.1 response regulator [Phenylobacterium sp.]MCA6339765.1 response regulator [Phenylobacterium sp.]
MPAASALSVLIVDDQLTMRSLVRSGLNQIGVMNTREAGDGEEAVQSLVRRPAHLVITDYNMPKLDGLGLLRAIRTYEPIRNTAVIMLTGRADPELVQRAAQFGVNNYLVKPFTVATLRGKIEDVFGALT